MIVWKKIWKENFRKYNFYFNIMKVHVISDFGYAKDEAYSYKAISEYSFLIIAKIKL